MAGVGRREEKRRNRNRNENIYIFGGNKYDSVSMIPPGIGSTMD